jgi:membrane-associated phospholipid phosphatase
MTFRVLADATVVLHAAFVLFVVAGGLLVLWRPRVAWLHVPAVVWGVWVEFAGWICPLTYLENWLRMRGGQADYTASFVDQYLLPVLYPPALSREVQWVLAAFVLAINAGVYLVVLRARTSILLPPLPQTRRLPAAVFIAAFVGALYLLPMHVPRAQPALLSPSAIDLAVPFLDWTIWMYFSYGLFLLLPFAVCRDDGRAARAFYAIMVNSVIAALIFLLWPTSISVQHPAAGGMTGLLWSVLLAVDRPTNCFPSLHVANACVCAAMFRGEQSVWRFVAPVWALLIAGSTLTTKQHIVIDLVGGAALAGLSVWLVQNAVRVKEA